MQVKSIAECSKRVLSTFIKLPFVFKTFVLSIFEWPLKTGFTVHFGTYCSNDFSGKPVQMHPHQLLLLAYKKYDSR